MSFEFVIQDNIEIPKRTFEGVPRQSQYPIDEMTKGQSFALPIEAENSEDAKKKAAQKQSYFSSLAKRRGVKVVTRYFPDGEEGGDGSPVLRVWHDGERTAEDNARDEARAAKRKATMAGNSAAGAAGEDEDGEDEDDEDLDL